MTIVTGPERGRVSLRADDDGDRNGHILRDGTAVSFGRGAECDVRFGHAPLRDREVPRLAGRLVVAAGRVLVDVPAAAPGEADAVVRPIVVRSDQGAPRTLERGEIWGPPSSIFTVIVTGERTWELDVVSMRDLAEQPFAGSDVATVHQRVELSEELWAVLEAYAAPVLRGERFPATHEQVAQAVHWNKMTVRRRLERIYDEFYLRRLEMPDVADMRMKVVEAALTHGLLPRRDLP